MQDWLHWLPTYLSRLRDFVQQTLADGKEPKQIPVLAIYDRFVGDRLPKEKHKRSKRHEATVAKIVQEVMHPKEAET